MDLPFHAGYMQLEQDHKQLTKKGPVVFLGSFVCNITINLASYPGSPAFIQLNTKGGNKVMKRSVILQAGEPGISLSHAWYRAEIFVAGLLSRLHTD